MNFLIWLAYRLVKWCLFWPVIHSLYRFDVRGEENLPKQGGYILASNHLGRLDTLVLPVYLGAQIVFATKSELFRYPGLKQLLILTGQLKLVRHGAKYSEMKEFVRRAKLALKHGLVLAIFPEGTRSKTGHLLEFWSGSGKIATSTGSDIVPVGLSYSPGSLRHLRRTTVHIAFGEPISSKGRRPEELTLESRRRIAELSGQKLAEEMT